MSKRSLPFLQKEITRHGVTIWYFRRNRGNRVRIRGDYMSEEFLADYNAAMAGVAPPKPGKARAGTLAWLIDRYRASGAWAGLKPSSQRQRENILKQVVDSSGAVGITSVTKKTVVAARDRRASTPHQANHFVKALRAMFKWAVEADEVDEDPTQGVSLIKVSTEGHAPWTDAEIAAFEARWPIGTRERLALAILLYTGLRRGDVAILGRQHVKNSVITIKTEKKGTPVVIPVLPELQEIIDATPTGNMTFIATASGKPMAKASFGNWFRKACDAAGVYGKAAHGIRKSSAEQAAYGGASDKEMDALFGWRGGGMSQLYTAKAERARLAENAIETLSRRRTKKEG